MKYLLIFLTPIFLSWFPIRSASSAPAEWQVLTKQNFSSQIQLHPHILLLVALPWSGESRSLMKDVALVIADKVEEFGPLKLRYIHRNTEKMLADSIGATTDEITLVYFHYSMSFKFQGRLKAKNILSSLYPYMILAPEEVPLKALKTPKELRMFLDSTDKALVLVDLCGWTPKLLAEREKNGTENDFSMHGDLLGMGFGGRNDIIPASRGRNNQKVAGEDMCKAELSIDNGFSDVPWAGGFTLMNDSVLEGAKDKNSHVPSSCTFEEFEHFHSFYLKFMTSVREFFMPPERHRFGLVSERSILSSLGIGDSGSWFAVHYLAGCPSCLKILKEEDDLKYALQMDNYFVKELEGKGGDQEISLPANKPSVILFVDRSSDSSETRGKSKEALDAFRELAQHYRVSNQIGQKHNVNHEKFFIHAYQRLRSTSEHPRLKLSVTAQKIKLKEKLSSIMIINDGKHVNLDKVGSNPQRSSLNEIFYFLQQNKDGKLSSLAKDLGFQLLSDDIDIKQVNAQQFHPEVQFNQMSTETSQEGHANVLNLDNDLDRVSGSAVEPEANSILTELSSQHDEVKKTYIDPSEEIKFAKPEESIADHELHVAEHIKAETEGSSDGDKSGEEFIADNELSVAKNMKAETEGSSDGDNFREDPDHILGFNGSFFYSDGNYQFLKTLTGNCRIPTLIIVDPIRQQHYVFPRDNFFNFSSLYGFLSGFLNETLLPYQQSEHVLQGPREATHPPFVNLDFHEVDSIPRVTAHTFSELVIGFNISNKENAWNKDVLVLFSYSWCGFCERMEMVVREVYQAFKGYMEMLKSGSKNVNAISDHESLDYVKMKLPVIYLLDCTLNDCNLILKSVDQREVYPALILFPAEKKKPLLYEGDMAVVDVIKFVAEHASYYNHLIREKGNYFDAGHTIAVYGFSKGAN